MYRGCCMDWSYCYSLGCKQQRKTKVEDISNGECQINQQFHFCFVLDGAPGRCRGKSSTDERREARQQSQATRPPCEVHVVTATCADSSCWTETLHPTHRRRGKERAQQNHRWIGCATGNIWCISTDMLNEKLAALHGYLLLFTGINPASMQYKSRNHDLLSFRCCCFLLFSTMWEWEMCFVVVLVLLVFLCCCLFF